MGVNPKIKAIFLDRDGVLNDAVIVHNKPYPPNSLNKLKISSGVKKGMRQLKELGYLLIVITNQPDVARGTTSLANVDEINSYLRKELNFDDIFCCFHDNNDNCECRKPKPGLIFSAAKKWDIDLTSSFMVGDRWRDIETGKNAGIKTILIDHDYDEEYLEPDFKCYDFNGLVQIVQSQNIS